MISKSVSQTKALGRIMAKKFFPGTIIALFGDLGSGKTTLIKGIAKGLGLDERYILSPSFILIREYQKTRIPLYHFDLFRIKDIRQIYFLGYEEYLFGKGITVIEWAERIKPLLPSEYLKIRFQIISPRKRLIEINSLGKKYNSIIQYLNETIRDRNLF